MMPTGGPGDVPGSRPRRPAVRAWLSSSSHPVHAKSTPPLQAARRPCLYDGWVAETGRPDCIGELAVITNRGSPIATGSHTVLARHGRLDCLPGCGSSSGGAGYLCRARPPALRTARHKLSIWPFSRAPSYTQTGRWVSEFNVLWLAKFRGVWEGGCIQYLENEGRHRNRTSSPWDKTQYWMAALRTRTFVLP